LVFLEFDDPNQLPIAVGVMRLDLDRDFGFVSAALIHHVGESIWPISSFLDLPDLVHLNFELSLYIFFIYIYTNVHVRITYSTE
jgi:hypothetical protein